MPVYLCIKQDYLQKLKNSKQQGRANNSRNVNQNEENYTLNSRDVNISEYKPNCDKISQFQLLGGRIYNYTALCTKDSALKELSNSAIASCMGLTVPGLRGHLRTGLPD